jgi:holo-[acyl-carrier protein] synthase
MIFGIGIDLVSVSRIERVIGKWGDRFLQRVFSPHERQICSARAFPASAFALRFAAKEAFSKAVGLGMRKGLKWREVEVFNDPVGKPHLRLYGASSKVCLEHGITGIHLSLSDEHGYGIAMVVLEK